MAQTQTGAQAETPGEYITLKHAVTGKKVKFVCKGGIGTLTGSRVHDFLVNAVGFKEPLDVLLQPSGKVLGRKDRLRDIGVVHGDELLLQPKPVVEAKAAAPVPVVIAAAPVAAAASPEAAAASPTDEASSENPDSAEATERPLLSKLLGNTYIFTKHPNNSCGSAHDRYVRLERAEDAAKTNAPCLVWSQDAQGKVSRKALNMNTLREVSCVEGEGWTILLGFGARPLKLTAKSKEEFTLWWSELGEFVSTRR